MPCEILAYRVRQDPLGEFEKEFAVQTFEDLDRALDQKPDAVFVTNPTSLHIAVALKAAGRGIPLFIEKPLSDTLDGVDSFIRVCEEKKLPVLLGYKMRFHPAIRAIKGLLDSGRIGKILSLRAEYGGYLPDWHPWEDYRRMYSAQKSLGGGVILDAAIHELDYIYWLAGPVREVKALSGKVSDLEIETEDTVEILLGFESGAIGSVYASYAHRPDYRACRITASEGSLVWDTRLNRIEVYAADSKSWEHLSLPVSWDANEMFVEELRHFLDCLEGRQAPCHSLSDARHVLALALKAKAAGIAPAKEGRFEHA